ncbi:hypothetical protein S7711_10682 [Stachybotrys chartarum IBT 7711]|uniref:Uncharacterized protein n=1 Tax=Stachybotrys chartarum (strain CBS 109288 / IBT 7711) TaxID=1280523 RepID=A0A084AZJ6_STACB|nr:hypothetical protein S7711_10682 [Stachybotrys chartarum IBT 7711]KFA49824.1 hypothetical protein S40293_11383 [Stachybotrys chartarum IBT 40293]KFA76882.1 hypothetical protein S40288_11437 [Stachybotrys chartarum IBT 40288]
MLASLQAQARGARAPTIAPRGIDQRFPGRDSIQLSKKGLARVAAPSDHAFSTPFSTSDKRGGSGIGSFKVLIQAAGLLDGSPDDNRGPCQLRSGPLHTHLAKRWDRADGK